LENKKTGPKNKIRKVLLVHVLGGASEGKSILGFLAGKKEGESGRNIEQVCQS